MLINKFGRAGRVTHRKKKDLTFQDLCHALMVEMSCNETEQVLIPERQYMLSLPEFPLLGFMFVHSSCLHFSSFIRVYHLPIIGMPWMAVREVFPSLAFVKRERRWE